MKKAVIASLLAVAMAVPMARIAVAQDQGGNGQQGLTMPPAEYNAYNNAITQTDPHAKASALEGYLTSYPQSAVKAVVLQQLMIAYSSIPDPAKALDAADRLLQVDPNNLQALTVQVSFRRPAAEQLTDPAAKQAALDKIADYAKLGLAATKPEGISDADFNTLRTNVAPVFYSAIGYAALNRKDTATAIENYKKELASVPVEQTISPQGQLLDTYYLGLAYLQSTPPDLANCAYYVGRFVAHAPEPYKSQMTPTAKYCYRKFHGKEDGYDQVIATAAANLNPPADFKIVPAPSPADIANQVVASTPDLSTLAISDKEFILQHGKPEDAAKVWDTIKGKSVQIPDAIVIAVTDTSIQVAVSEDAVQSRTADFTFVLAPPDTSEKPKGKTTAAPPPPPAVGDKITLTGTYASFTPDPIMITMSDAAVVVPEAPKKPAPKKPTAVHRTR